jgi:hypothetical protein
MLRKALVEILWIIILTVLFGAVFLLASCSTEGAGFSNSGAYAGQKLCRHIDKRGNEKWFTAPASGDCRGR